MLFKEEIVPIKVLQRKKDFLIFDKDEHFRPGLTMEKLKSLPTPEINLGVIPGASHTRFYRYPVPFVNSSSDTTRRRISDVPAPISNNLASL